MTRHFVISDLHLGMGRLENGDWHPLEDFKSDAAFGKFLGFVEQEQADELIINGDWIDFLQLEPFAYSKGLFAENGQRLGWTEEESLQKLESCRAAHAHKEFFDYLRDFLKAGRKVTVIMGNHDPDIFWPRVQVELRNLLRPPKPGRLEFIRTFVRRGTAHIEHGNQHCSPENKFQDPKKIFHPSKGDGEERLEMIWGSIFVMEFFNSLERTHPYADKIKPTESALWLGIKNRWVNGEIVALFVKFLRGAGIPFGTITNLLSEQRKQPIELIKGIKDKRIARELLEIYGESPEFKKSFDEEIGLTAQEEWKSINAPSNDPPVSLDELTPTVAEESRTLGLFREGAEFRGARKLLKQDSVSQVIFGHTHMEIDGADPKAKVKNYFNTGTWIKNLDLKKGENRESLENITMDDLKKDELFELRLMTAVIDVNKDSHANVSLQRINI
jgi:UDP-2,3-diacylglucosamine pyrophosphatase LpxH